MPTDLELFVTAKTKYANLPNARAAEQLAHEYDLSVTSVRGRLSRADTPYSRTQVLKAFTQPRLDDNDPSVQRQLDVIEKSEQDYKERRPDWSLGIFVSDLHAPYTRWDALELVFQIVEDLQPDVISAQNDGLDNAGYGRWDDDRTARGQLWGSDVARQRRFEEYYYGSLTSLSGGADLVQVLGNHDRWYYDYMRKHAKQDAERILADYMEFLYELGVQQFTRGYQENAVRLSPNLIWWHGQFVSANSHSNAKNTIRQFVEDGVASSAVVGHSHRPTKIAGFEVGYNGVNFYNSGCISRTEHVPYLRRDPRGWGLGIVVNLFDQNSRYEEGTLVNFHEKGKVLEASYKGKVYRVPLDKSSPEW